MKRLHFDYDMQIKYTEPVSKCHYTIKCEPPGTDCQHIDIYQREFQPDTAFCRGQDSFGNLLVYGTINRPHSVFRFHAYGDVTTGLSASEAVENESMIAVYRYPSVLTKPAEGLKSYFGKITPELTGVSNQSRYEQALVLMHRLHQDFCYEQNITNTDTTAEAAWAIGKGVCQDYSHILIALCRTAGIPARYVAGMLIGEGRSHAWVEVLSDGRWYALDPTNDIVVTDSHIKLGVGRDAADCMINRGILTGGGTQTDDIRVSVNEIP